MKAKKNQRVKKIAKAAAEPLEVVVKEEDYYPINDKLLQGIRELSALIKLIESNRIQYPNALEVPEILEVLYNITQWRHDYQRAVAEAQAKRFDCFSHFDVAFFFYSEYIAKPPKFPTGGSTAKKVNAIKNLVVKRVRFIEDYPYHVVVQLQHVTQNFYSKRCAFVAFVNALQLIGANEVVAIGGFAGQYTELVDSKLRNFGLGIDDLIEQLEQVPTAGEHTDVDAILDGSLEEVRKRLVEGGYQGSHLKALKALFSKVNSKLTSAANRKARPYCAEDQTMISLECIQLLLDRVWNYPHHGTIVLSRIFNNLYGQGEFSELCETISKSSDTMFIVTGMNDITNKFTDVHCCAIVTYKGEKVIVNSNGFCPKMNVTAFSPEALIWHFPLLIQEVHALRIHKKYTINDLQDSAGKIPWHTIFSRRNP